MIAIACLIKMSFLFIVCSYISLNFAGAVILFALCTSKKN